MATMIETVIPALCAWRENRGGQKAGMQSVLNVLYNRSERDRTSMYAEATKRLQFSSLTAKNDPELIDWPVESDAEWPLYVVAEQMTVQALANDLPDITGGATDYYAPRGIGVSTKAFAVPGGATVPFPETWDQTKVEFTVEIADQLFFKEIV